MDNPASEPKCRCCYTAYAETDKFCGHCGYPLQGSPDEQKQFSIEYTLTSYDKEIVQKRIAEARIVLFVIAAFTLIQSFIFLGSSGGTTIFIINLILSGIYLALGFWARKKAFSAILTGGLLYISILLLNGFLAPSDIYKGIVIKIVFIVGFIRASYGAYKFKI